MVISPLIVNFLQKWQRKNEPIEKISPQKALKTQSLLTFLQSGDDD